MNPIHVNRVYAASTRFHKPIAHGILGLGLISNVLGAQLPGSGAVYLEQTIKYIEPVYIGDTLFAYAEVIEKDLEKNRVCHRT
jgi:3-hydroxybutyryl-CoA dehydratase